MAIPGDAGKPLLAGAPIHGDKELCNWTCLLE